MIDAVRTARDRMIVTWLSDSGLRIGELCGLSFCDLHLRNDHACGERKGPHFHKELDLRSPHQDFFSPMWTQGRRARDLAELAGGGDKPVAVPLQCVDHEAIPDPRAAA